MCTTAFCIASRGFLLGMVNRSTGLVTWRHVTSQSDLEDEIALAIQPTHGEPNFGFCFVRCVSRQHRRSRGVARYVEQLVLLPIRVPTTPKSVRTKVEPKFNFNIIWLDSVSRNHFIRSLPKSTDAIRALRTKASGNPNATRLFDFQLFQTVKARTREMLSLFWTGEYSRNNDTFHTGDDTSGPIRVETLLRPLKRAGYNTLWLEDSCWHYESDLINTLAITHSNLTMIARWQHIIEALERASIDAIDVSLAMCVMYRSLAITDQFHGPAVLCHNGRHVHDYLFDYLQAYQRASSSPPHATFFVTNVAHEDTGRRLQTLDDRLASYLSFAATMLPDTVTLVVSDHGNSYGVYPETLLDGRLEVYNPVLMMLVPARVRRQLGRLRVDALADNERRLVSMGDVHLCLRDFVSVATGRDNTASGLLGEISTKRTCDDLPIDAMAYCVCRDHTVAKPSDDWQALIAEFAVGTLNEAIRIQYQEALPNGASDHVLPPHCHRLVPLKFGNVTEKYLTVSVSPSL